MRRERLLAPAEHLGVLFEPDAQAILSLLTQNNLASADGARLLDADVASLRRDLRRHLGLDGPLILTGHQAEFYHAGVFAKNVAAARLAANVGGCAVFLTVDSDTPKSTHLAVPLREDGTIRRETIAIPGSEPGLPVEHQPARPATEWRRFFEAVARCCTWPGGTMLDVFRNAWLDEQAEAIEARAAFERAHTAMERALDMQPLARLRASQLCATPEFRAFIAHLALRAGEFLQRYNGAQRAYRERHRIRSPHRPVEPLIEQAGRVELPFWAVRRGQPRRRLSVLRRDDVLLFYADDEPIGELSAARAARMETHTSAWPLEREGWNLRPRALTLSAFCRLLLCDLFIHGIGGAKYDEMTEEWVGRFWGVRPAPMACVSATLRLPLGDDGASPEQVRAARHRWRDVHYNPQRYLSDLPADWLKRREDLIKQTMRLRREAPHRHDERRRVFHAIHDVNRALLERGADQVAALERAVHEAESAWQQMRIARDREYFYALHPRSSLEQLVRRVEAASEAPASLKRG